MKHANEIIQGDALEVLRRIPAGKVQTCVTSPPYWGLRDYGTAEWEGGDANCEHTICKDDNDAKAVFKGRVNRGERERCLKCGAKRVDKQLGLEKSPDEYTEKMVEIFREVHRVLRKDGTLWLNIGDSYASGKGACHNPGGGKNSLGKRKKALGAHPLNRGNVSQLKQSGLKPKDLVGIPWRLAFALQADGWYLRSDIIWSKPNPMPESVTDRPTRSHEYMFLLTKAQRYYYDGAAISEKANTAPGDKSGHKFGSKEGKSGLIDNRLRSGKKWDPRMGGGGRGLAGHSGNQSAAGEPYYLRQKRSVWVVSTNPYPEAHFAVFPTKLIEPCILAGSKPGDIVLDPFAGSGTTCLVAEQKGRQYIGIELNPDYIKIAKKRLRCLQPEMFA